MFPINLDLRGRLVVMVGAGRVGRRKLKKALQAGARVRLVEPNPDPEILILASAGAVELTAEFHPGLLAGASLVFAATDDRDLNRRVAGAAREAGRWVNVADSPEESDFNLPAVVERGDLQITVATGGLSPALAARTAARLREMFGPEYGRLARLLGCLRPRILASGLPGPEREEVFRLLADSEELLGHLARKDAEKARRLVRELLEARGLGGGLDLPPDCFE